MEGLLCGVVVWDTGEVGLVCSVYLGELCEWECVRVRCLLRWFIANGWTSWTRCVDAGVLRHLWVM